MFFSYLFESFDATLHLLGWLNMSLYTFNYPVIFRLLQLRFLDGFKDCFSWFTRKIE